MIQFYYINYRENFLKIYSIFFLFNESLLFKYLNKINFIKKKKWIDNSILITIYVKKSKTIHMV